MHHYPELETKWCVGKFFSSDLIMPSLMYDSLLLWAYLITILLFQKMNTRRNADQRRGEAAARCNQVPPQAPTTEMKMHVNPAGLTNWEVRTALVQMAQAFTLQAQAMTAQAEKQDIPRKNPPASTMSSRLRDFTRMNPLVYTGSKIVENLMLYALISLV